MLNIVLVEPEIPQNTGNIARTCVAMNCNLHLVGPMGFSLDEKQVRRSGLDYWPHLKLFTYPSWADFLSQHANLKHRLIYFSTKAKKDVFDHTFEPDSWLVFGPETRGLDVQIIEQNLERAACIPMVGAVRSLNLSNAVAIGVYEAYRQTRNTGAKK
jgi:tRNA (cytidine/uridine-2'-O-)-methyltransferase